MKVFLSWSGETSKQIALALRDWLPIVLQYVEPFMSSEEIEKGTRWATTIATELETTSFGILCMTPENVTAPWIQFEAGALAKVVTNSRVAPLLHGLRPSDLQGPLTQFQVTTIEREDLKRLVSSMNSAASEEALTEARLEKAFSALWGQLEAALSAVPATRPAETAAGTSRKASHADAILEELLVLTRKQAQLLASAEAFRPLMEQFDRAAHEREFLAAEREKLAVERERLNSGRAEISARYGEIEDYRRVLTEEQLSHRSVINDIMSRWLVIYGIITAPPNAGKDYSDLAPLAGDLTKILEDHHQNTKGARGRVAGNAP